MYKIYLELPRVVNGRVPIRYLNLRYYLDVENKIVIGCLLHERAVKVLSAENEIVLDQSLQDFLKKSFEYIESQFGIRASIDEAKLSIADPSAVRIQIATEPIEAVVQSLAYGESSISLLSEVNLESGWICAHGTNAIEVAAEINPYGLLGKKHINVESVVQISSDLNGDLKITSCDVNDVRMLLALSDVPLCYTHFESAANRFMLMSEVELDLKGYSVRGSSSLLVNVDSANTLVKKMCVGVSSIEIDVSVTDNTKKFESCTNGAQFDSSCSATLVRRRLLSEIDALMLSDIDSMTLFDLDYVILS